MHILDFVFSLCVVMLFSRSVLVLQVVKLQGSFPNLFEVA